MITRASSNRGETHHISEEWQEWMDWTKTSDDESRNKADNASRTSFEYAYQLPSPQTSINSDLPVLASKKRKTLDDSHQSPVSVSTGKLDGEKAIAQNKSHSIVEKRYRTNLNQKITELGKCVPNLNRDDGSKGDTGESRPGLKHNKATVLTEAIAYIAYIERRNMYLEQANTALKEQSGNGSVERFPTHEEDESDEEKLTDAQRPLPISPVSPTTSSEEHSEKAAKNVEKSPSRAIQGMIKVPEEWRRMWSGELKSHSIDSLSAAKNSEEDSSGTISVPGGKYMGRLMVGSLAGIAILDSFAITQKEGKDERGLSAVPVLRHIPRAWYQSFESVTLTPWLNPNTFQHSNLLLPMIKGFLLFGVLGLLLFIYLFNSRPPSRRKPNTTPTPQPAPSIASPLEVRQRAFLTAIQTIWFPRHRVIPEILALNLETAAYMIRQLLGWQMYSWLTGRSEDGEIARVRAWDIAIDAQLSGGDPEISKSRLVLSLWASGTLPSSPTRFMLKAVHIRILFWQPSKWPWLTNQLHRIACKLARWQWNKAHRLQARLDKPDATKSKLDLEPLTDHLRALLEHSSEAVMTDEIIQRAHNLAWNTFVTRRTCSGSIHEDTAMRGPLDAIASWFSHDCLTDTLKAAVSDDFCTPDGSIIDCVDIADQSAPPGSLAKVRALAMNAVFDEPRRQIHLRQLHQQLAPTAQPSKPLINADVSSSALDSLVVELPQPDSQDVKACVSTAITLDSIQAAAISQSSADAIMQAFQTSTPIMGSLGWTGIYRLIYVTQQQFTRVESKVIASSAIDRLDQCSSLDLGTKIALKAAFTGLIGLDKRWTKTGKRRCSESSNDTGYASMSDDDEEGCEPQIA